MKTHSFRELSAPLRATPEGRAEIDRHRLEALGEVLRYNLAELRRARATTQAELAARLGVAQPGVSRLERTEDPHLSTVRGYVEALGGRLRLVAVFDGEEVELDA